ncbi:hypothetical protein JCM8547_006427 [Rhodosporidiobolus lusitaniae]
MPVQLLPNEVIRVIFEHLCTDRSIQPYVSHLTQSSLEDDDLVHPDVVAPTLLRLCEPTTWPSLVSLRLDVPAGCYLPGIANLSQPTLDHGAPFPSISELEVTTAYNERSIDHGLSILQEIVYPCKLSLVSLRLDLTQSPFHDIRLFFPFSFPRLKSLDCSLIYYSYDLSALVIDAPRLHTFGILCLRRAGPALPPLPPSTQAFFAERATLDAVEALAALCAKSSSLSRLAIGNFDRSPSKAEREALRHLARTARRHGVRLLDALAEFEEPGEAVGSLAGERANEEGRVEEEDPEGMVNARRGKYGMDWNAEDRELYRPYRSAERRKEYAEEQLSSALQGLEQHPTSKLALERWRKATDVVKQAYVLADQEKECRRRWAG